MSRVVIAGAGPAGVALAWLLGRAGLPVTLVERRRDFTREFRGEILMPSGIEALRQMGLGDVLQSTPGHPLDKFEIYLNGGQLFGVDLAEALPGSVPLAFSQSVFLQAVIDRLANWPNVEVLTGVSVHGLQRTGDRVTGVELRAWERRWNVDADLVIGADGRNSLVRRELGTADRQLNPPMDIVWGKVPGIPGWRGLRAYAGAGHLLLAYTSWDGMLQIGWVILKGTFRQLQGAGVGAWVQEMANHVSPDLRDHLLAQRSSVSRPFLLEAVSDRVESWWQPGAWLLGDAAHTMSPVGGQGINIALRDVVVAVNHLLPALANGDPAVVDRAGAAFEAERRAEVEAIQFRQSLPPLLVLRTGMWGAALRQLLALPLRSAAVRQRAARHIQPFLSGIADVRLEDSRT